MLKIPSDTCMDDEQARPRVSSLPFIAAPVVFADVMLDECNLGNFQDQDERVDGSTWRSTWGGGYASLGSLGGRGVGCDGVTLPQGAMQLVIGCCGQRQDSGQIAEGLPVGSKREPAAQVYH